MLEILKSYQSWRRGEDERSMDESGLTPKSIGEAIDFAISAVDERDQIKDLLQSERDNIFFMAKRLEQLEKSNLELAVDLSAKRIEVKEYELWIAAIAENHSAVPDWIRQSARSMLAKGAK